MLACPSFVPFYGEEAFSKVTQIYVPEQKRKRYLRLLDRFRISLAELIVYHKHKSWKNSQQNLALQATHNEIQQQNDKIQMSLCLLYLLESSIYVF